MNKKNQQEPSFETAFQQLETLVEKLEEGDVPLQALVEQFEIGTRLIQICESHLKKAEMKISKLRADKSLLPFDPDKSVTEHEST